MKYESFIDAEHPWLRIWGVMRNEKYIYLYLGRRCFVFRRRKKP
jgi:hypothetical protein